MRTLPPPVTILVGKPRRRRKCRWKPQVCRRAFSWVFILAPFPLSPAFSHCPGFGIRSSPFLSASSRIHYWVSCITENPEGPPRCFTICQQGSLSVQILGNLEILTECSHLQTISRCKCQLIHFFFFFENQIPDSFKEMVWKFVNVILTSFFALHAPKEQLTTYLLIYFSIWNVLVQWTRRRQW